MRPLGVSSELTIEVAGGKYNSYERFYIEKKWHSQVSPLTRHKVPWNEGELPLHTSFSTVGTFSLYWLGFGSNITWLGLENDPG